jgi:hypothetical protein
MDATVVGTEISTNRTFNTGHYGALAPALSGGVLDFNTSKQADAQKFWEQQKRQWEIDEQ